MNNELLIGITSIVVLGITAQWLAWKMAVPSILLLLLFGFIAGPLTGFLRPDNIFGDLLFPIVSISVAIILFEGGLSLKIKEISKTGQVVRNLISIGALVTWIFSAAAANIVLGLNLPIAILLGAILVVTGPTVIIPLLRHVRAASRIGSIIKWEGIVNDPIGAILSVLVLEAILAESVGETIQTIIFSIIKVILLGGLLGFSGASTLVFLLKKFWIPGYLHSTVPLMIVVVVFVLSNLFQAESGLFSVTIMGIVMANQSKISLKHIIEFKENLGILLISVLFIILSARLDMLTLSGIGWDSIIFLILLIILVRPLSVLFSTIRSGLNWKEKVFIAMMAPRGVVAAAVTSIFAVELVNRGGYTEAVSLVPEMFFIIVGTVFIYGLCAVPLGRWLGLATPNPQGIVIAGTHSWAREIGKILMEKKFDVLMVDTNRENINQARMSGLVTIYGSILSDYIFDEVDFSRYGKILALTPNNEVNSLAMRHFNELFGRAGVFQLSPYKSESSKKDDLAEPLKGRILFGNKFNYTRISELFDQGYIVKTNKITEMFSFEDFSAKYGNNAINMFIATKSGKLRVITADEKITTEPGDTLISLAEEKDPALPFNNVRGMK